MIADDDAAIVESGPSCRAMSLLFSDEAPPSDTFVRPVRHPPSDLRQIGRSARDGAFQLFGADITTPRTLFSKSQDNILTEVGVDEGAVIKDGARSVFNSQPPCSSSRLANEASQESDQSKSSVFHLLNATKSSQEAMHAELDEKRDSLGTSMTLLSGFEAAEARHSCPTNMVLTSISGAVVSSLSLFYHGMISFQQFVKPSQKVSTPIIISVQYLILQSTKPLKRAERIKGKRSQRTIVQTLLIIPMRAKSSLGVIQKANVLQLHKRALHPSAASDGLLLSLFFLTIQSRKNLKVCSF